MIPSPRLATFLPATRRPTSSSLDQLRRVNAALEVAARSPGAVFILIGLLAALPVGIAEADPVVHVRFVLTMGAFYLAGALVEEWLGVRGDSPFAPIHRVALGQLVLVLGFYVRSLLAHAGLPGVTRFELCVALGAIAYALSRRVRHKLPAPIDPRAPVAPPSLAIVMAAGVWVAFWISTHRFLAYRTGALQTPSSDPDGHAFMAKLVMMGGKLAYSQAPYSDAAQTYPSAFAALNALWGMISGASIVNVLNCQMTLQACLAVGLVVEAAAALRRELGLGTSLVLLGIAHWLFFFPVNAEAFVLGGTARFSHTALLLWPLTFAIRLGAQSHDPLARPAQLRSLAVLAGSVAVAWALVTNPSHVLVALPVILATALVTLTSIHKHTNSTRTPRRWLLGLGAAAILLPALLVASDAMVVGILRGSNAGAAAVGVGKGSDALSETALKPVRAARAGLKRLGETTSLGIFPHGCILGNKCQFLISDTRTTWPVPLYAGALIYVGFRLVRRGRAHRNGQSRPPHDLLANAAYALLAVGLASLLVPFLFGLVERLMLGQTSMRAILLRVYVPMGLRTLSAYLYFALLSIGVVAMAIGLPRLIALYWPRANRGWKHLLPEVAMGGILLGAMAINGEAHVGDRRAIRHSYRQQVTLAPKVTSGWIRQTDVDFAKKVESIVPNGERVLLPSIAAPVNENEDWSFPQSTSRAIPLYTSTHFAFFMSYGPIEFSPVAYTKHVCATFDLPWLAAHGVNWVVMSDGTYRRSCVHNWLAVHGDYFEEVLRVDDRKLYRLRADRLSNAAADPRLDFPLPAPSATGPKGEAIRGYVEPHGPYMVTGWACDFGSPANVVIELELTNRADPSKSYREFHQAALLREPRVAQACGGTADHGFTFAPSSIPRGTYFARVLAYDGPSKRSKLLADDFILTVPM